MRVLTKIRTRKAAVDLGIIAAVSLFFVAGVFFESKRSGGRTPALAPGVDAAAVTSPVAGPGSNSLEEAGEPAAADPIATPAPATAVAASTPDPRSVGQPVFLDLTGIENESVIDAAVVTISGTTTPDALLSINGEVVAVQLDGTFSVELTLEPGPNFIELVASNLRGQEASRVISVVSIQ